MEVRVTCDCCASTLLPAEKYYLFGGWKVCSACATRLTVAQLYKKFGISTVSGEMKKSPDEIAAIDAPWY